MTAEKIMKMIKQFFESKWFIAGLLTLFVLQAVWIAVSFRYPMIYDEGTHFTFIQSYSHTLMPYTTDAPGSMTTQISLFHYLSSFVYRALDFAGANQTAIIIVLRVINIALVAAGIYIYAKLLNNAGIKRIYVNVGLLLFVLLPITPFVSATINYDNMVFLFTALYLYVGVRLFKEKTPSLTGVMLFLTIGLFATLVKFSTLPLFIATGLFIIVRHFRRNKFKETVNRTVLDIKKGGSAVRVTFASFIALLVITAGLYGGNIVRYHSVVPSCLDLYTSQQCMQNALIARNDKAKRTAHERPTVRPDIFILGTWIIEMEVHTMWTGNSTADGRVQFKGPLPVMELLLFIGIAIGTGLVIYTWRTAKKSEAWKFLVAVSIFWVLVILAVNMSSYYRLHQAFAIQPRYLLIVLPIALVAIVFAASAALGQMKRTKLVVIAFVALAFTQGGGVITHIVGSENSWYWQSEPIIRVNDTLRKTLESVVKE